MNGARHADASARRRLQRVRSTNDATHNAQRETKLIGVYIEGLMENRANGRSVLIIENESEGRARPRDSKLRIW
jgi:hypothetical protein